MPSWILHKEVDYPSNIYLSSLGVGSNLKACRDDAIQQIVLYFDSQIKVQSSSSVSFRETKDSVDKTKNLSQKVELTGKADLPSLAFTEAFFDEASGRWYICAYLDKEEFLKISSSEVQTGIDKAESAIANLKKTSQFSQFIGLSQAIKDFDFLQRKAKQIGVLDVVSGKKMNDELLSLKNKCFAEREALKEGLQFSIQIEDDFDEIVSTALEEILESQGFVYAPDAQLCLKGRIKTSISENNAGSFATPRLTLRIVDAKNNGKTLASYSKSYKKWGHMNVEGAMRKAFVEVEKDLKLHFMEFFYSLE